MNEIWIALSVGLVVIIIIVVLKNKSETFREWNYKAERKGIRLELKGFALEARQNGATYYENNGPSIYFYRERDGIVEQCFAEYSIQSKRYEWVTPPTTGWHSIGDKIPDRAWPLPN